MAGSGGRPEHSTSVRAQLVQAAIETIAAVGYARASYAAIAERAGLSSTGLISYHFASKADLVDEVVAAVVAAGQAFMLPRIEAAAAGRGGVRAYIVSNLEFMATHPEHKVAVVEVLNAAPRERAGQPAPHAFRHVHGLAQLEGYLSEGQRNGQLRRFLVTVMAEAIRAAIDAAAYRLAGEPQLDLAGYGEELATLFDRAVAAEP